MWSKVFISKVLSKWYFQKIIWRTCVLISKIYYNFGGANSDFSFCTLLKSSKNLFLNLLFFLTTIQIDSKRVNEYPSILKIRCLPRWKVNIFIAWIKKQLSFAMLVLLYWITRSTWCALDQARKTKNFLKRTLLKLVIMSAFHPITFYSLENKLYIYIVFFSNF